MSDAAPPIARLSPKPTFQHGILACIHASDLCNEKALRFQS